MEQELTKSRCSWVNTITGTAVRQTWGGWTSPRLSTTRITTATPLIMTSLFSGWPPRLNGVPTPTSDRPVCLSMVLETMISGCRLSQDGEQHLLVDLSAMCSLRLTLRSSQTPSATTHTEESQTTCCALLTLVAMEAVMLVREIQVVHLFLVVRTATVEPLLDRTMT